MNKANVRQNVTIYDDELFTTFYPGIYFAWYKIWKYEVPEVSQ
jgi:hypothetical protein